MDIVSRPPSRSLCDLNQPQGPTTIDYHSLLQEDEYHKLSDSTIHNLLKKIEERMIQFCDFFTVSTFEQLQVMTSKRQYKEAAEQLEAVNQLCSHFEAYRDVPKITELREKVKNIKQVLKSRVFSDFVRSYTCCTKKEMNQFLKWVGKKLAKGFSMLKFDVGLYIERSIIEQREIVIKNVTMLLIY
ncbi:uncharacterized protein LOC124938798 [Impatiens glandulifera]|uniref:uncharacterized protein LOC124938798 n=1 Tax=Impatiens glandulifera TaxID=253017 RepID=UPI001FB13152|nr:uncharacterized protein LOC124938798 [Impatiens glandulifera]